MIPDTICTKERQKSSTLCGLQETQQHYHQELISVAKCEQIARQDQPSYNLHQAGLERSIQPDTHEKRRRIEDSFQNLIQTLQVCGYAIQTHKHTSNMSGIDQQHHQSTPGLNSYCLPRQYSCLLKNTTGTYQTCEGCSTIPTKSRA